MLDNKKKYKVGIIIPSYNERNTLHLVVQKLKIECLIIIVNDCSNDGTFNQMIIKRLIKKKKIKVINNKIRLGYDGSLQNGFLEAVKKKCEIIITIDADNQFDLSKIRKFIKIIQNKNIDLICTERKNISRLSEIVACKLFNLIWTLRDPFSGLKLYKITKQNKKKFLKYSNIRLYGLQYLIYFVLYKKKIVHYKIKIKKRIGNSKIGSSNFMVNLKMIMQQIRFLYFILKKN